MSLRRKPLACALAGTGLAASLWLFASALGDTGSVCATEAYPADAVKAAFLYRFCGYISWPVATDRSGQFVIVVLDNDGVAAALDKMTRALTVNDQPVTVLRASGARTLETAQLVYVGSDHLSELRRVVARLAGKPTLVVSDDPGDLSAGSAINLVLVDQRVRFRFHSPPCAVTV